MGGSPDARMEQVVYISDTEMFGTGVYIGDDRVLTAGHLATSDVLIVISRKGEILKGVVSYRSDKDFAIITVKGLTKYAKLSKKRPKTGAVVDAIGHPLGMPFIYSRGYVARSHVSLEGEERIASYLPAEEGSSGSPVWEGKRVIGIITEVYQGLTFIVPSEEICKEVKC